eukprot:m.42314 g.42314  ORF g.42314 m.42314 type:complete len:89 (-) comp10502_c0_seq2:30-296(-)
MQTYIVVADSLAEDSPAVDSLAEGSPAVVGEDNLVVAEEDKAAAAEEDNPVVEEDNPAAEKEACSPSGCLVCSLEAVDSLLLLLLFVQ